MKLRQASPADAEAIARMVRDAWAGKVAPNSTGHQESPAKVLADLAHGHAWVLEHDGRAVGSVRMVRHPHESRVWEVKKLGLLPQYRGLGFADELMGAVFDQAFVEKARELRLAVRHDQPRLVEWYGRFGFVLDPELVYSAANPNSPPPFVMKKVLEVLS